MLEQLCSRIRGECSLINYISPGVETDKYTDTDYEFYETDKDEEDDRDTDEVPAEPSTDEAHQDHPAPSGDPVNGTHSLEEEIATLRQQLFAMEARAMLVEQERDEVVVEMTEMAQLLA